MSADLRLIFPFDLFNNSAMNTLLSDGTTRHEKQAYGSEDFLEPNKSSHQRHRHQMHKIDTLLIPNAKCAKRKLDRYMSGHNVATDLGLITREKCGNQNAILNEKVEQCSICRQYYPQLGVSDALIEGPNPKKGYLENHRKDLVTSSNYVTTIETTMEKSTMEFSKALESLFNGDFDNSSETSDSSSLENEDMELSQPQNNLSSEDNHIPRPVIPIGPRFQVEVPKWEGTTDVRHHHSDDDLKWLGIQLCPMLNISENKTKDIGEGRHDSCSCKFPGSVDCVELHVWEARELLKLEIGTTFSTWKFDEMGEDVSKSWTSEEQKKFESFVKLNMSSNGTNLWKLATKHFPSKSMKCMINYYHNVYIPRRLSMQTRSSHDVVDSDNDQDENVNKNVYSCPGRSLLSIYPRRRV